MFLLGRKRDDEIVPAWNVKFGESDARIRRNPDSNCCTAHNLSRKWMLNVFLGSGGSFRGCFPWANAVRCTYLIGALTKHDMLAWQLAAE
jgi:hypothetical protein